MRKSRELIDPTSCLSKADIGEMLFVLRARDAAAPAAIRFWIAERLRLGLNAEADEKITQAEACAATMEQERWDYSSSNTSPPPSPSSPSGSG